MIYLFITVINMHQVYNYYCPINYMIMYTTVEKFIYLIQNIIETIKYYYVLVCKLKLITCTILGF